jgi:hypothetical protein
MTLLEVIEAIELKLATHGKVDRDDIEFLIGLAKERAIELDKEAAHRELRRREAEDFAANETVVTR